MVMPVRIKGNLWNIQTKQNISGYVKLGNMVVPTDSLGNFDFQAMPFDEDTLKAWGYENNKRKTFRRRKIINGSQDNPDVLLDLVPLLHDSVGVSDTTFYWFADEGNFRRYYGYYGLKKIDFDNAQHPDSGFVYWISLINPAKTVLHIYTGVRVKQPADYLLEAIALHFPAKQTKINDILGLERLKLSK